MFFPQTVNADTYEQYKRRCAVLDAEEARFNEELRAQHESSTRERATPQSMGAVAVDASADALAPTALVGILGTMESLRWIATRTLDGENGNALTVSINEPAPRPDRDSQSKGPERNR